MNVPQFEPPPVTREDVLWATKILCLSSTAFTGSNGADPRAEILTSNETLDIEACPGSGKTTLLVSKLAILAKNWRDSRRGVCVLSHTNAARREIERRLGNTVEGRRLLSYPHFVGTIHGFVNEFLAIPWLRSKPVPIRVIDDEISLTRRWYKLPRDTREGLERNRHSQTVMKITDTDFSVGDLHWGRHASLGRQTRTYRAIQAACRASTQEGFFCYDEMFVWARELLDEQHRLCFAMRVRFPMLFVDEVQDNSELQSQFLYRLFIQGDHPVIRQRFGDTNQGIYQHVGQTEGARTDPFPDAQIRRDIPNSYRFGQEIGSLANPFALDPQDLVGCGPSDPRIISDTSGKCAIFLFEDRTIRSVVQNFARYLVEVFAEQDLAVGTYTAVGAVHRPGIDDKLPRNLSHYWPDYDHGLSATEPKPKTFCQYVLAGRQLMHSTGESHHAIAKIADGILHLVSISNPLADVSKRKRKHRLILHLLTEHPEIRRAYLDLVTILAIEERTPSEGEWNKTWCAIVKGIAGVVGGPVVASAGTQAFLEWHPVLPGSTPSRRAANVDNLFRYPLDHPKVEIRFGSIHSVKGETHTATLVVDTFFHAHHLVTLKPWLLGQRCGRGTEGQRNLSRLKQHYVALTRPSHLLCLAIREDAFTAQEISQLKNAAWRVARVDDTGPQWL